MFSPIIASRDQLSSWNDLDKYVKNEKFNIKRAYMDRFITGSKPSWRSLWCNNKASPRSVICLWQILQNRLHKRQTSPLGSFFAILFVFFASVGMKIGCTCSINIHIFKR